VTARFVMEMLSRLCYRSRLRSLRSRLIAFLAWDVVQTIEASVYQTGDPSCCCAE